MSGDARAMNEILESGRMIDIGKELQEAYDEGYMDALTDLEKKIENEFTKASWYSKGKFIGLIKRFKQEIKEGNDGKGITSDGARAVNEGSRVF